MIRRPPRSTLERSSAASDVYKRQRTTSVDVITHVRGMRREIAAQAGAREAARLRGVDVDALLSELTTCIAARRDGDRVLAVIRGSALNQDGRSNGLTAPNGPAQEDVVAQALARAGLKPSQVGYVEAHGPGTVPGDQARVQDLTTVLERAGAGTQESALGSIKSMIGHTKATAGVAGLMKASLALHHRVLPATLGVTRPNPKADFPHSPLYVNSETRPWIRPTSHPRRAGVSAFGFGGTDFHLALEEYDGDFLAGSPAMIGRIPAGLLIWRAASRVELLASVDGLLAQLEAGAEPSLADLAYSLSVGDNTHRGTALAIVAESIADLVAKLRTARGVVVGELSRQHLPVGIHFADGGFATDHQVAFVFPGQGSVSYTHLTLPTSDLV